MRVYFDNKGRIQEFFPQPIFATSDKVDKIDAYIDEKETENLVPSLVAFTLVDLSSRSLTVIDDNIVISTCIVKGDTAFAAKSPKVNVTEEEIYTFSFYAKANGLDGLDGRPSTSDWRTKINWYDGNNILIAWDMLTDTILYEDWKKYIITAQAPTDAVKAEVIIGGDTPDFSYVGAKAYFKNIQFKQKPYPTGFEPNITFKRSDGVVLGPFSMLPALDEQGRTYHTYTFNKIDIAVAGPLQISIRYNKYQYDDISDEVIIVKSKATAMITTYVYDVISTSTANVDSLAILYHKIKKIQEELGELDSSGDLHHIGDVPPEDYNKYRVWLDCDDEELIEMFSDFSNGKLNEDNIIPMAEQLLLSNDNDDNEELINNDNDNEEELINNDNDNEEELINNDNDNDDEQLIFCHEEEKFLF